MKITIWTENRPKKRGGHKRRGDTQTSKLLENGNNFK
jgi:hypothetical protein